MKSKKETFASLFNSLAYKHDLRPIFDDFLTLSLCAFSQKPVTGQSYDEDVYMETIAKYAKDEVRHVFPHMLALLIMEMEERFDSSTGNDVLGELYEIHFFRKGAAQFFTPWHVCELMAQTVHGDNPESEYPLRVLDPCCGSGRTLLAGANVLGKQHAYYGIDIDHTCVKMTAMNLFLNGVFHGEVMWADALSPNDFHMSYRLSFLPFGVFRVKDKEQSPLWHAHNATFKRNEKARLPDIILPSKEAAQTDTGSQLHLF